MDPLGALESGMRTWANWEDTNIDRSGTKKIEAIDCSGVCSPFEMPPCGSTDCHCIPWGLFIGKCIYPIGGLASVAKMIDEHPNLCQSHDECMKKGSGNFCARYPNHYMDYGWCFNSHSQELKNFLKMPAVAIAK
ncbi:hypothetical protein VNO78_07328 [Psophocarpus tetragonolobus]|uniref:Albumin I chain a domain-containing protein n=1 Tax=Psophocarpus tetragonolobus TaxID=3891 RepID=A0AAN9SU18_PSOTE